MSAEVEPVKNPHIECAGGCPPSHKIAKRVSVSLIAVLLLLLAGALLYLYLSGGSQ